MKSPFPGMAPYLDAGLADAEWADALLHKKGLRSACAQK